MALIVQSERWCEVPLSAAAEKLGCTQCQEPALSICEACGSAVCDAHELVCQDCGRSYCSLCRHACVAGQRARKAA